MFSMMKLAISVFLLLCVVKHATARISCSKTVPLRSNKAFTCEAGCQCSFEAPGSAPVEKFNVTFMAKSSGSVDCSMLRNTCTQMSVQSMVASKDSVSVSCLAMGSCGNLAAKGLMSVDCAGYQACKEANGDGAIEFNCSGTRSCNGIGCQSGASADCIGTFSCSGQAGCTA